VGLTLLQFRYSTYEVRSLLVDEQSQFIACADWIDPKAAGTKCDKFSLNLCRPKNVPVVSVFIARYSFYLSLPLALESVFLDRSGGDFLV
jgi:hypothetical protein